MTCSACSSHVEKSVSKLQGVDEVSVNLLTNSMQVAYDEGACNIQMITEAVENAGYGATFGVPIGSCVIEKYLNGEVSESRKYIEERMIHTSTISSNANKGK